MMLNTKETMEGRRIEARSFADGQVDAVRRYWYNDQWQVLTQGYWSQAYASFTLSRNYLYGNTIDEVLGFEWVVNGTPSIWYYYLHDHLYSPAAMLTDYGIVERYEYDAYGRRSVMTPGFAHRSNSHYLSDIGLTGREIDELDLDAAATPRLQHMHYRHRDYNSTLGRFMQQDPLGINPEHKIFDYKQIYPPNEMIYDLLYDFYFEEYVVEKGLSLFHRNSFRPYEQFLDGLNVYAYVQSSPINYYDPLGLCSLAWCTKSIKNMCICLDSGALDWGKLAKQYSGKKGSKKLVKLLQKWGGVVDTKGGKGSHIKIKMPNGKVVTVPVDPAIGTAKSILKAAMGC